jgi:hypothetical protein
MRFLRSGWFLLTLVVLLALGWYTWGLDWLAERKWQAYVVEARARGVKFTLEELRPPRVPESEDLLQADIFRDLAKGGRYHPLVQKFPTLVWQDAADGQTMRPDWAQTRKGMQQRKLKIDRAETSDVRAVQGALGEFHPLLDALSRLRVQSVNWDDLWTISDSHRGSSSWLVIWSVRMLPFKAQLDLASGEVAAARESLDACMRLARCYASAPGLAEESLRQRTDFELQSVVYAGLEMRVWRDEDLRAFIEFYTQQNVLERYRWALETERARWAEYCDKHIGTSFAPPGRWSDWRNLQLRVRSTRKRWWRINGEWLQRFFDEEMVGFDPARGTWSIPQPRKVDISKIDPSDVDFGLVNTTRFGMEEFLRRAIFTHAMNKMAGIACGLELHRRKQGEYPEQLEELSPEFLAVLPNDPCGGKSFRYFRDEKEGYRLYSIGADERDDGGGIGGQWSHPDWRWWAPRSK